MDDEDDGENVAKQFRRALNTRKRPNMTRLTTTSGTYNQESFMQNTNSGWASQSIGAERIELDSVSITTRTVEGVPVYREIECEEALPRWKKVVNTVFPQPIYNALKPPVGKEQWKKFWQVHVPIWYWLLCYTPKQLIGDFISGITIGVTHIPQGIGFALLAMVPPVFGLYSSFVPVILYTIFGTSRHLSVGTFPVVSLLVGDAVARISNTYSPCDLNSDDGSGNISLAGSDDISPGVCDLSQCDEYRVSIAITLSMMVGVIMVLMSFLKLGVISLLLSDALISGYTAAAAFSIVVTQMGALFGLEPVSVSGYFTTPRRFIINCTHIVQGSVTVAAIVTSIICFIILITVDITNRFLKKKIKKIPVYIPGQLIVVILVTGISYGAMLNDRYNLQIIDDLGGIQPGKCYKPTLPSSEFIGDLVTDSIVISIIGFVINIAQAKLLAQKNGYSIYPDQELFAYGVMNLGGSFFGSFPTAGALSRTVLQDATGGHTQLVGLISSFIVLFTILFLGPLFGPLPNAVVGVIVVMALKGLFFQVRDIRKYFHLHWPDMFVWLVVFCTTLIIGLDVGLGIGVLFSMGIVMLRTVLPFSPGLGEASAWIYPHSARNRELGDYDDAELRVHKLSGIYIFQFNAPLYYANCGVFKSRLFIESGLDPHTFDVATKGCFQQCYDKAKEQRKPHYSTTVSRLLLPPLPNITTQQTAQNQQEDEEHILSEEGSVSPMENSEDRILRPRIDSLTSMEFADLAQPQATDFYHTIVLDCGPIGFVDSMGVAMLEQIVTEFDAVNIQVLLAAPSTPVCEALNRYGFFKRFSPERLFPSLPSAVHYAKGGHKVAVIEEPERLDKKLASNLERLYSYSQRPSLLEMTIIPRKGPASLYKQPQLSETLV